MTLKDLLQQKIQLNEQREKLEETYKKELLALNRKIQEVSDLILSGKAGFDVGRIANAKKLVRVGDVNTAKRADCVRRFINQLVTNPEWLAQNYCGVKVYSGFGEQGSDHANGYGPSHGSIVFRVKLLKPSLSEIETDDVLYYLLNIQAIQAAEKEQA